MSREQLVSKLLSESNEVKRNDKGNDVLSKIMQKMPLDLKEKTSPLVKGNIMRTLVNAEQFFDTTDQNKYVSLNIFFKVR